MQMQCNLHRFYRDARDKTTLFFRKQSLTTHNSSSPPTCWALTEGIAGTENQCLGVAESLGLEPEIKRIGLNFPWSYFSPWLGFENNKTFSEALEPPWPDILIASGRKSIAASRYVKKMSRGKTFTVQIQDPRVSPKHFDLVAVPEHDRMRGGNVIVTKAAPNRISAAKLEQARHDYAAFEHIPAPRAAVLLGGSSKTHTMTGAHMEKLGRRLADLETGLMMTASRRTGEENIDALKKALGERDYFLWDGRGANPYFGMLAWADFILVTEDSSSMLSEAATTGKPVYLIPLDGGSKKFSRLHDNLMRQGAVRRFEGVLEHWDYAPLNDADKVAQEIKRRLSEKN